MDERSTCQIGNVVDEILFRWNSKISKLEKISETSPGTVNSLKCGSPAILYHNMIQPCPKDEKNTCQIDNMMDEIPNADLKKS